MTDTHHDAGGLTASLQPQRNARESMWLPSWRRPFVPASCFSGDHTWAYLLDLFVVPATLSLTHSCLGFRFDSSPTLLDHSLSASFSSLCSFLSSRFNFHPTSHYVLSLDYPINACNFSYSLWSDVFQIFICLGSVFPVSLLDVSIWVLG